MGMMSVSREAWATAAAAPTTHEHVVLVPVACLDDGVEFGLPIPDGSRVGFLYDGAAARRRRRRRQSARRQRRRQMRDSASPRTGGVEIELQ